MSPPFQSPEFVHEFRAMRSGHNGSHIAEVFQKPHPNLLPWVRTLFKIRIRLTDSVQNALCYCKLPSILYIEG